MDTLLIGRAALKSVPSPARDVMFAIALKCVLLLFIYLLCFGPRHRSPSDAASTASALIGTDALTETR